MDEQEKRIQELIRQAGSKDWNLQMDAYLSLGRIDKSSKVPALIEALKDENEFVRRAAANLLGIYREASAVPALIKALEDESKHVWDWAADSLGQIGVPAMPALIDALKDKTGDVRLRVDKALGKSLENCKGTEMFQSIEDVQNFENKVTEFLIERRKKYRDKDRIIRANIELAKLVKKVSERKNQLASKRDVLLDDKPKPPERGQMFQAAKIRRIST